MTAEHPKILRICRDQQHFDTLGGTGNAVEHTPSTIAYSGEV